VRIIFREHLLENIFLLRHANSAGNEDNSLNQRMADHAIPLAQHGPGQAMSAGSAFSEYLAGGKITLKPQSMRIWCSPYLRTNSTCDYFLKGFGNRSNVFLDRREDFLLTEQQFGLFNGLSEEERARKFPEENRRFQICVEQNGKFYAMNPDGESRYDVAVRARQFSGTIIRDAEKARNPVPNVLLVSHGTWIRAFVMCWLHKNIEWFDDEPNPNNASIRHIGRDNKGRWQDFGCIYEGFPDQEAIRKKHDRQH